MRENVFFVVTLRSFLSLLVLLLSSDHLSFRRCLGGPVFSEFIKPNFTATNLGFVDNNGAFLASKTDVFRASIYNPSGDGRFYLCIIHKASNRVVWSANPGSPISNSDRVVFSVRGIYIYGGDGSSIWWAETARNAISSIQLQDTGNLVLLDASNSSLWQSFDHPTDTILPGQTLNVGVELTASVSKSNLSISDYRFVVTKSDSLLQWKGQTYWSISMDPRAFKDQNPEVTNMLLNTSGLYLFSGPGNASMVVWKVALNSPKLRLVAATMDSSGKFVVQSYSGLNWDTHFSAPEDDCSVPLWCGHLGVCSESGVSGTNNSFCTCPPGLPASNQADLSKGCTLSGVTQFCSSSATSRSVDYLSLGSEIDYFATTYEKPLNGTSDRGVCQELCSSNCSCVAYFYKNPGSCYLVKGVVGSLRKSGGNSLVNGYLKIATLDPSGSNGGVSSRRRRLSLAAFILLPAGGTLLLVAICAFCFSWWKKPKKERLLSLKTDHINPQDSDEEIDLNSILGLPVRFSFSELEGATSNFGFKIGTGGFGAVFRGVLQDGTQVAVKKINNVGSQGKKEFLTEIATIGSIHHVNLVRLVGFCGEGSRRLLVYEYMNRSSLDRSLFQHNEAVLEWPEREEIAVGTARGLAYLHSSCQPKIIHCDVKPENILLNDAKQIKLSDFGLSKLLTMEQSNLFTAMRGTRGYLAPEWLTNSAISEKTDVYSYGMVLLEIISGRKNCLKPDNGGETESYFPLYALEMHEQNRYAELVDRRLAGKVTNEEAEKMVKVALCCVQEEPWLRPSMSTVVAMLEGVLPLCEPRVQSLTFLRFHGRRFSEPSTWKSELTRLSGSTGSSTAVDSSLPASFSPSVVSAELVSGPR